MNSGVAARAAGLLGIVAIIAGSFLPWAVSGGIGRNSYQLAGLAGRIGLLDGPAGTAVAAWPWLGPVCILPVLAGCLRWWRTAAGLAVLCGLASGGVAALALIEVGTKERFGVALATTGPVTMLVGGALAVIAGVLVLVLGRRRPVPPAGTRR